jgi:hypothetical protein
MFNLSKFRFFLIFMLPVILFSCGDLENKCNSLTGEGCSNSSNKQGGLYHPVNEGYLVGEEISIWENPGGKANALNTQPLTTIGNASSLKIEVTTAESDAIKTGPRNSRVVYSFKDVIKVFNKTGWLRVKYNSEAENFENFENFEGFVDIKNVYSDARGKILFAVSDSSDQSITIDPANYSTSSFLSPNMYYGPYVGVFNGTREKHCDLLDAALVLHSANSAERGEFETQEEFRNRVKATKLLANMTKWNEKIYTGFREISGDAFAYNVDSQIMTAEMFGITSGFKNLHNSDSLSSRDIALANMVGVSFDMGAEGTFKGCPAEHDEGLEFVVNKTSFGKFKISICPGSPYSSYTCSGVKIKMDRETARVTKESRVYRLIYGLRPSKVSSARQWREHSKSYNGSYYSFDRGAFKFVAEVLYIFLVNESGKLMQSYTTSEYINNYLENDLYIQTNAHENRRLIPEIEKLTDKEKISKLLWNRMRQDK